MYDKHTLNSLITFRLKRAAVLLFDIIFYHLICANYLSYAQNSRQNIRINYNNKVLNISAKDADLKNVLLKIADKANIFIRFPVVLKQKVTIKKNRISLKDALQNILRDFNHVIIYSGSSKNRATISKVIIFEKSKKPKRLSATERRITNRIRRYERQIKSLKNKLSRIDENSRQGKRYLNRIKLLTKNIRMLGRRLN